jgi:hypothetical protein
VIVTRAVPILLIHVIRCQDSVDVEQMLLAGNVQSRYTARTLITPKLFYQSCLVHRGPIHLKYEGNVLLLEPGIRNHGNSVYN